MGQGDQPPSPCPSSVWSSGGVACPPFSTALDCLPSAVFLVGLDHCIAYCNPKFCEVLGPGTKESAVLGRPWHALLQASGNSGPWEELLQAVAQGQTAARPVECSDLHGNRRVLQVTLKPLPMSNPPACMGMVEDVTSSYQSDELHGLIASGINCLRQGVSVIEVPAGPADTTPRAHHEAAGERQALLQQLGRLVYANPALEQMSGQCQSELQAGGLASLLDPSSSAADIAALVDALHSRTSCSVKLVCMHRVNRIPCWTSITVTPINQLPFTCAAWLPSQLHGTGCQSPWHDNYSRSSSREMPPVVGLTDTALPTGLAAGSSAQGCVDERMSSVDAAMLRLTALHHHHRHQNSSTGSLLALNTPLSVTQGPVHYLCIHEDITASVSQEMSWQLRDHALSSCSEGITIADPSLPDAPLVYVNDAFLHMTGYSREEVIGRNCRFLQGPDTSREAVATLKAAVAAKRKATVELLNYTKDGEPFWNRLSITPVFNAAGELVSYIGVQSDVTELIRRKEEERRLLEAKVAAENATEAKSMFLANMSHEIRTPLNGMMATAQLLLASCLNPEQRELAETVLESGNSLLGILGDILDFSKLDHGSITLTREPTDLRRSIESCIEIVAPDASKKGIMLYYTSDDQAMAQPLMADGIRLRQVLTNLLSNAVKFTERGEVHVDVRVEDAPPAQEPPQAAMAAAQDASTTTASSVTASTPSAVSKGTTPVRASLDSSVGRVPPTSTAPRIDHASSAPASVTPAPAASAPLAFTALGKRATNGAHSAPLASHSIPIAACMEGGSPGHSSNGSTSSSPMHSCTSTGTLNMEAQSVPSHPVTTILPPATSPGSVTTAATTAARTVLPVPPKLSGPTTVSQLPLLPLHVPVDVGEHHHQAHSGDPLQGLSSFLQHDDDDSWNQAMQLRRYSLEDDAATGKAVPLSPSLSQRNSAPLLLPLRQGAAAALPVLPARPSTTGVVSAAGAFSAGAAAPCQRRVHIQVRDTGIGIPQDVIGTLFQCFKQGSESMARKYGGTGLGLAISKRLSELMQGSVWVESEGKGHGCTFHFCLPADFAACDGQAGTPGDATLDAAACMESPLDLPLPGEDALQPIEDGDAWSGIPRPAHVEGAIAPSYASSTGSSSGGAMQGSSQGQFSLTSSEDHLALVGRCVLVDMSHPGLAAQIAQSCKQLGMQARLGGACSLPAGPVAVSSVLHRAEPGTSPSVAAVSVADLRADILVVSTERASAALKAGWKGRPVVAVGPRDLLSPNLWPLVVPCALPVMHARLTTALVKSLVLLRWAPGRRTQGPKLTHQPISPAQIADFKTWRDRGQMGKLSAALLQSQQQQQPAASAAFRGQYVGGQLAISAGTSAGAGQGASGSSGQNEAVPGFAGGFGRASGSSMAFDLARRSSLDNSSLERALVQQMMAATQARAAALSQQAGARGSSSGAAGGASSSPPELNKHAAAAGLMAGAAAHGHWRSSANGVNLPASIPEDTVLTKIDEDGRSRAVRHVSAAATIGVQAAALQGVSTAAAQAAVGPGGTQGHAAQTTTQAQAQPAQPPLRILIAEDNKVNQKVVLKVLQQISGGAITDVVENGLQALQALERKSYDLILMDIHMPEMDGLEATRRIMATHPPATRPRIIALSADTLQDLHDKCREAGIEEFIVKPFRVEDLKRVMQTSRRQPHAARPAPPPANSTGAGAAQPQQQQQQQQSAAASSTVLAS